MEVGNLKRKLRDFLIFHLLFIWELFKGESFLTKQCFFECRDHVFCYILHEAV